jgi:hypothetical protein
MSDVVFRIISKNEKFVPSSLIHSEIRKIVQDLIGSSDLNIKQLDQVEFIDQGSNFEAIECPKCKSDLEIDWWQENMERANGINFINLDLDLPCCNNKSNLNELKYIMPAGFAKFLIEILNPTDTQLTEGQLIELEKLF